jgi:hypothetical protein
MKRTPFLPKRRKSVFISRDPLRPSDSRGQILGIFEATKVETANWSFSVFSGGGDVNVSK